MAEAGGSAAKSIPEMALPTIEIYPDLLALSRLAAERFARLAQEAVRARGYFLVCLSGGSTPARTYRLLAEAPYRSNLPWGKMAFFWGDERMVPPDHPESNYGQALQIFLSRVPVKDENIHRIKGELSPADAVNEYTSLLRRYGKPGLNWPRFDLLLLGMGADGHIASIFPGTTSNELAIAPVLSVRGGYQDRPVERVTLTPAVFNSARQVIFLVAGADKADALATVCEPGEKPEDWPARLIRPTEGEVVWMVDAAAAAKIRT